MFTIFTLLQPGGLCTQNSTAEGSNRAYKIFALTIYSRVVKALDLGSVLAGVHAPDEARLHEHPRARHARPPVLVAGTLGRDKVLDLAALT